MATRVVINGREVRNPLVKRAAATLILLALFLVFAVLSIVVLPLVGIALGVGLALGAAGVLAGAIGVPILRMRYRARLRNAAPREAEYRVVASRPHAERTLPTEPPRDGGDESGL